MSYMKDHFPYNAYDLEGVMAQKGYKFFKGNYDLNIIGVRTDDNTSNTFNDWITFSYQFDGKMNMWAFPCTTDPGLYYRENPANVDGTAIVVPGQYGGLWQMGKHQGKYKALTQVNPINVYRDANRDEVLDKAEIKNGIFGINMHRSNESHASVQVDKWSAGCQVFQDPIHFAFALALCDQQIALYKDKWKNSNSFTYTLLEEQDFTK